MKPLANSPIIEALAQINYDATSPISFEDIEIAAKLFNYTNIEDINELQLLPDGKFELSKFGKKLTKSDENTFFQITRHFFACSITEKYQDWTNFSEFTNKHLSTFLSALTLGNINRLALRYTNKIPISGGLKNLDKILNVRPEINMISSFAPETINMQITMPVEKIDGRANVSIRVDQTGKDASILLLDLDVFMTGNFKPELNSLMLEFNKIRDVKNEIFKKVLTNDCINSFNG